MQHDIGLERSGRFPTNESVISFWNASLSSRGHRVPALNENRNPSVATTPCGVEKLIYISRYKQKPDGRHSLRNKTRTINTVRKAIRKEEMVVDTSMMNVCSMETEMRVRRLEHVFIEMTKAKEARLRAAEITIQALAAQNDMLKDGIQALHVKLKGFEIPMIDDLCRSEEVSHADGYLNVCFPATMTTGMKMDGTPLC